MKKILLIAALTAALAGCSSLQGAGSKPADTAAAAEVKPEVADALKKLRTAAEAGDPAAQTRLGMVYARGEAGVATDISEAAKWFRKASDQGFAPAQTNLAVAYLTGQGGVPQDPTEAARLTKLAAEQGWPPAMTQLGFMYGKGAGVKQSWPDAEKWLRQASAKGDENAKRLLSEIEQMKKGGAPAKKP